MRNLSIIETINAKVTKNIKFQRNQQCIRATLLSLILLSIQKQELLSKWKRRNDLYFNFEPELKIKLQQIIQAYDILKKERIVHSDVHPGNILIGFDNKIKLCDFEYSYKFIEEIQKNNEPLIMHDPNKFERFLALELLI